jgi:hypothetical protein
MASAAWKAARDLRLLTRSDFSAGALWLAEMELAAAHGLRIERVFLHPQLTEIALAGSVRELFVEFARRVRAYEREPGLVTHNPVRAAQVLGPALLQFAAVVSPCNAKGYRMAPNRAACEALIRSDQGRYWASKITAGGSLSRVAALMHLSNLGACGAVINITECTSEN